MKQAHHGDMGNGTQNASVRDDIPGKSGQAAFMF